MKRFILALCLVASTAFAQEHPPQVVAQPPQVQAETPPINTIVIGAPSVPIQPLIPVDLTFSGLTDDELPSAKLSVVPADGAVVKSNWDWIARKPVITFWPIKPGKYTVSLTLNPANEWRREKVNALLTIRDDKMGPDLVAEWDAIADAFAKKLEAKFPFKSGSAVVEVAGVVPFPTPDPNQPTPPKPSPFDKVTRVTYVFEKDNNPVPKLVALALQRINAESAGSIVATEFEEDSTVDGTPGGRTPSQYLVALKAAREAGLPALVVQSGDSVQKVVKAPTTAEQVLEAVK